VRSDSAVQNALGEKLLEELRGASAWSSSVICGKGTSSTKAR
jgi:hypothetical protein